MKNKKAHPLADAQAARLDILYGGSEAEIIRETMKIATDAMRTLELEEHVFVINTLMNKRDFEPLFMSHMDKRDSLRGACFFGKKLIEKLSFFEHMIPMLKVRMVIVNNFDLAVFNSRHRMQLLEFIKWLRDDLNIHVIVCMNNEPATWGAQGSLRMMASSIEAIGGHEEAESQEMLGISSAAMNNAMYPLKRDSFTPSSERTQPDGETTQPNDESFASTIEHSERPSVAACSQSEDPREIYCTEDERDLADYKVRESDIPREYTPFSDPERYGNTARAALRNKELAVENV